MIEATLQWKQQMGGRWRPTHLPAAPAPPQPRMARRVLLHHQRSPAPHPTPIHLFQANLLAISLAPPGVGYQGPCSVRNPPPSEEQPGPLRSSRRGGGRGGAETCAERRRRRRRVPTSAPGYPAACPIADDDRRVRSRAGAPGLVLASDTLASPVHPQHQRVIRGTACGLGQHVEQLPPGLLIHGDVLQRGGKAHRALAGKSRARGWQRWRRRQRRGAKQTANRRRVTSAHDTRVASLTPAKRDCLGPGGAPGRADTKSRLASSVYGPPVEGPISWASSERLGAPRSTRRAAPWSTKSAQSARARLNLMVASSTSDQATWPTHCPYAAGGAPGHRRPTAPAPVPADGGHSHLLQPWCGPALHLFRR